MTKNELTSNSLKDLYFKVIAAEVKKEFNLKNINQVPKLRKIVLNTGIGRNKDDKKFIETATNTLRKISAQQPYYRKAKKSIAAFKLREGNIVGLSLTLRGDRMYQFLYRIINIVLPRQKDFHGVKIKAFDKDGNYSLGFSEQSIFPELSFEETSPVHGLQMNIVFSNPKKELTRAVLSKFGLPFEKENK